MEKLTDKKFIPCEGGIDPLSKGEYNQYLQQIKDWTVLEDTKIEKEFTFGDFKEALEFVNECGKNRGRRMPSPGYLSL